jgi:hypothetical protein
MEIEEEHWQKGINNQGVIRPLIINPLPAKIKILAGSPPVADQATRGRQKAENEKIKISIIFNLQPQQ